MTEQTKLLPCPFCGEAEALGAYGDEYSGDHKTPHFCANCDKCGAEGAMCKTREEAIKAWDTRATPTGTIITKAASTWPATGSRFFYRRNFGSVWGHIEVAAFWHGDANMIELWLGCIWWPTDNLFNVPEGE